MSKARRDTKRDGGRFLALPHEVIDCVAYRGLGHVGRSLLIDIARQYNHHNNGKLTACMKYLRPLGWKSADTITRAKAELLASGLLIETRKGARPNKAAWYMLAWFDIDISEGMDSQPETYQRIRRAYRQPSTIIPKSTLLIPPHGIVRNATAPSHGVTH